MRGKGSRVKACSLAVCNKREPDGSFFIAVESPGFLVAAARLIV